MPSASKRTIRSSPKQSADPPSREQPLRSIQAGLFRCQRRRSQPSGTAAAQATGNPSAIGNILVARTD